MKSFHSINIFSSIGPDTLKAISADIKTAGARPIRLRINSPGGLVSDGLAIYSLLNGHKPGVHVDILGVAASMATVLACVGKPVRMAANALFMIHNPWTDTVGNADQLRRTADTLDAFCGPMVEIYVARTKLPEAEVRALMDAETWLTAEEAKTLNFVDEIAAPAPQANASIDAAARRWPKLAASLAKASRSNSEALAARYAAMPAGPARQAFYTANKWALFAARRKNL